VITPLDLYLTGVGLVAVVVAWLWTASGRRKRPAT